MGDYMPGNIEMGIVNSYDPQTCTAEVTSYDGISHHYNVGMLMDSYDTANGVYSYTPPSVGAPCVFTEINGEVLILGQYAPANLGYATDNESPINSTVNRSVSDLQDTEEHLPGDWQVSAQSGALVSLRNMVFNIRMNPLFYSAWNIINSVWDNMCNIFKFSSPAADILVDVDDGGNTNVAIQVRTSSSQKGDTPSIDLQLGATADVVLLKINGEDFCHVTSDRTVTMSTGKITIVANGVDIASPTIKLSGGVLDCMSMGKVKLPR